MIHKCEVTLKIKSKHSVLIKKTSLKVFIKG